MKIKIEIDIEKSGEEEKDISITIKRDDKIDFEKDIKFKTKYGAKKYVSTIYEGLLYNAQCMSNRNYHR